MKQQFVTRLKQKSGAFTLVELLIVCAVIALLLAMILPPLVNTMAASRLTSAGDRLQSLLAQAQQIALSDGRPVEVRLYRHRLDNSSASGFHYRTAYLLRYYDIGEASPVLGESGVTLTAPMKLYAGESLMLPDGVVMASATAASSLLSFTPVSGEGGTTDTYILTPGGKAPYQFPSDEYEFQSFVFRPTSTNLPSGTSDKWFVTLISDTEESEGKAMADIPNYYCVQVDPVNGRVTTYRP